jgi:RNA polymerase sigma factor (sigma-70 family)
VGDDVSGEVRGAVSDHVPKGDGNPAKVPVPFLEVDPDLVRAAQGGDAFALDELIEALHPLVRRICARVAGPQGEDAAQEALLAIFRDLRSLRTPEAIVSWASLVTARIAARVQRTDRRQRGSAGSAGPVDPIDAAGLPSSPSGRPSSSPWIHHVVVELTDVLERLPERDRAVLVLRDLQGISERDIAERLGVPVGTVKSRVHRARRRFREEWDR